MRVFRVVVIDDDAEVLRRVPARLSLVERCFEDLVWRIELVTVHVRLEGSPATGYKFSPTTFQALREAFSVKSDLILSDYVFIERSVLAHWLGQHKSGLTLSHADLENQFSTLVGLANAVEEQTREAGSDRILYRQLQQNFLDFTGPLVLYTMTTEAFLPILGQPEARAARVRGAFKQASTVKLLDTNYEIYDRQYADSKHERSFYAHAVGGLIDKSVQVSLLEAMLEEARKLRYLRYPRSVATVFGIVAVGGGVAAVAEFLGGNIGDLLRSRDYAQALIAAGFGILVAFAFGLLLPLFFGRVMSGLISGDPARQRYNSTPD